VKKKIKLLIGLFLLVLTFSLFTTKVKAEDNLTLYFFWGQGCPHCVEEKAFLDDLKEEYPQIKIEDYEVYAHPENLARWQKFCQTHGVDAQGIPSLFIKDECIVGFRSRATTGKKIIALVEEKLMIGPSGQVAGEKTEQERQFTIGKIFSLALVDAINPCALAVLLLMLTAILAYNPGNKKEILKAGLAFIAAVLMMYLFYGLVIIRFFQLIKVLGGVRLWLYRGLGVIAIILGILEIKDFLFYKPGGLATEMPISLRPKVKKIINGVTSPRGAFGIGLFVTLFLLPCTIGPYLITGGLLSYLNIWQTLPWLVFYNIIFVLPMLAVTLFCFLGLATVTDIEKWKVKNIKIIHLLAGVIISGLGLAILLGWV